MHKTTRLVGLFGALALVASACGGSATSAPSAAASAAAPSAAASAEASAAASAAPSAAASPAALTGTLTVWEAYGASGTTEKDAFDKMVANVMAANPGLTVTVTDVPFANLFTNFETQAGAGSGPDLYIAPNDSLPKEARASLLKDVSSLIPTLTAAPYNTSQVAIDASTVDGKLYEIPESMKAVELFYNNTVIKAAPATTADWMTNAKQLGWVYGATGGGSYYLWGLFGAFGGTIMDATTGKCTADQKGVADALKWLADMKAAGMKFYKNDGDAKADLLSGKIAGFIDGPWQSGDLSKALGSKLSVTAGPSGPGGAWAPLTAPDGFYINQGSANADLAVQFALQMLLPANEQLFANAGHLPANTTLQPTDPIAQSFAALMPKGFARPTLKQLDGYWGNFGNALVAVIDKGTDPTKAVADACAAMNKANGIQ
ncbi:MAG TPA: extracellular solute-binding protein [Cryobacterium sp.]|nr:extracellular solute-binding protein [Cryobacterium sp.]